MLFLSCFVMISCETFIGALWSPAGKGLTIWVSFVLSNCKVVSFSHCYPGSGVLLGCIDSRSLPSFLLTFLG